MTTLADVTDMIHAAVANHQQLVLSPEEAEILSDVLEQISGQSPIKPKTLGEILESSGAVGAWSDRTDIVDSVEYAKELRRKQEQRTND